MQVFLITAFVALTVAKPDIGLLLRQQQQGTTGYEYQSQQHIPQIFQQQHIFTVNHNEDPSQLTPSISEVFFIKYETQQEADENYARAPTRVNPNELPRREQYLQPFQQQQGYYYQPQQHQQLNSQYNNQQQQTFTPKQENINNQTPPSVGSYAIPPNIIRSNKNSVVPATGSYQPGSNEPAYHPPNNTSPSIQVNQNILQGVGNNEAIITSFSSNNVYLPPIKSLNTKNEY